MFENNSVWRKCNSCKKPIALGARYYVCSVSTCNSPRTGYVFCSVACWEIHLPGARHKDAAAIEMTAPANLSASEPARRIVTPTNSTGSATSSGPATTREVLIIASRLKDYVQVRSGMNTSASVIDTLSDFIRLAADRACDNARAEGRKTVLDRDFVFLKKS